VLWFLASSGLRLCLRLIGSFSSTYGSVGAVIAILIGDEVNSIIEQAAARAGDAEAKLPGEKAPGEREYEHRDESDRHHHAAGDRTFQVWIARIKQRF
jgi:hypothetical protein